MVSCSLPSPSIGKSLSFFVYCYGQPRRCARKRSPWAHQWRIIIVWRVENPTILELLYGHNFPNLVPSIPHSNSISGLNSSSYGDDSQLSNTAVYTASMARADYNWGLVWSDISMLETDFSIQYLGKPLPIRALLLLTTLIYFVM